MTSTIIIPYEQIDTKHITISGFKQLLGSIVGTATQVQSDESNEDPTETLLNNRYFVEEVNRTREDFTTNFHNLRKYPRFNKEDWR